MTLQAKRKLIILQHRPIATGWVPSFHPIHLTMIYRLLISLLLLAGGSLIGCNSDEVVTPPTPPPVDTSGKVAYVLNGFGELGQQEIYIQNLDGSGKTRVHFGEAPDLVTPGDSELTVRESGIFVVYGVTWNPDGRQLLIDMSQGPDQSRLLVMDESGKNAIAVSPVLGNVSGRAFQSLDGLFISYIFLSTFISNVTPAEIFVADLSQRTRAQTTEDSGLRLGRGDIVGWQGASELFISRTDTFQTASHPYSVGRLQRLDIASGQFTDLIPSTRDQIGPISTDGTFAILKRWQADGRGAIVRRVLSSGEEKVLLPETDLVPVKLFAAEQAVLLSRNETPTETDYNLWQFSYHWLPIQGGSPTRIPGPTWPAGADVYMDAR